MGVFFQDIASGNVRWSDRQYELFGVSRAQFHGHRDDFRRLILPEDLRTITSEYERLIETRSRRFRFEFRIHARTREAAKANAQGLGQLSAERVRDEWFKGIQTAVRVSKLLDLWMEVGAARIWLPEISRDWSKGKRQLDKLPRDPVLISAFLATDPASLLTRLKSSNRDIERGRAIGQWRDNYPDAKNPAVIRYWLSQEIGRAHV